MRPPFPNRQRALPALVLLLMALLAACGPVSPSRSEHSAAPGTEPARSTGPKTMTMNVKFEVTNLLTKALAMPSSSATLRVFNAAPAMIDGSGLPRPYLAETLPELGTASWRVLPDGHVETTYRLKPGLTWHDGTPLTSADFAFALAVYNHPKLRGQFLAKPQDQIEAIDAPDARTFVLKWTSVYPGAGSLGADELPPLPRHLLEAPLAAVDQGQEGLDAFLNSSFWTASFVGVGPFKLDGWVPGLEIDASAFDGHALGRPKIDRLIIRSVNDDNANLTGVLSGNSTISVEGLRFEHGSVLKREWATTGAGILVLKPGARHYALTQFKLDYLKTAALMDVRVRRALAHSVDRDGLNDVLFDGAGYMTDTFTAKQAPYNAEVERAITRYPYDPRRSEQLMEEAGFPKDTSGFFSTVAERSRDQTTGPQTGDGRQTGQRLEFDFWEDGSTIFEREQQIMADTWTRAGFGMRTYIIPAAQQGDSQLRATFPGLYATSASGDEKRIGLFTAGELATASNRWRGGNRAGWSQPEFERLWDAYNTELDPARRTQVIVSMMKVLGDELPAIMLYFNTNIIAHSAALSGPSADTPESMPFWNIYLWDLK